MFFYVRQKREEDELNISRFGVRSLEFGFGFGLRSQGDQLAAPDSERVLLAHARTASYDGTMRTSHF